MAFTALRRSCSFPSRLVLLVTFPFVASRSSSNLTCYDTNGVQTTLLPCLTRGTEGPCCHPGWICLSNGLFEAGPNVPNYGDTDFYRSDCTNPYWNDTACFPGCNDFTRNGVQACGSGEYCCYNFDGCDCASTSLFDLGVATIETTITMTSSATSTSTFTSTSSSTTQTTSSSLPVSTAAAGSSTPSATSTSSAKSGSSDAVAIGVGVRVGVGVGLILLGMLDYFMRRRRTKKKREQRLNLYVDNKQEMDGTQVNKMQAPTGTHRYEPHEMPEQNYRSPSGMDQIMPPVELVQKHGDEAGLV